MITRTKSVTLTFKYPFSLKGVDRRLTAGQYEMVSDEELIEELSFPVYRRVSTVIFLPPHGSASVEMVNVDPADLAARRLRSEIGFYQRPR
jgi:hypothetical protein